MKCLFPVSLARLASVQVAAQAAICDLGWKDVRGIRGPKDAGEWNRAGFFSRRVDLHPLQR